MGQKISAQHDCDKSQVEHVFISHSETGANEDRIDKGGRVRKDEDGMQKFGAWIREHREALGMTQNELGRRSGTSRQYIGMLEGGGINPATGEPLSIGVEKVSAIAKALGEDWKKTVVMALSGLDMPQIEENNETTDRTPHATKTDSRRIEATLERVEKMATVAVQNSQRLLKRIDALEAEQKNTDATLKSIEAMLRTVLDKKNRAGHKSSETTSDVLTHTPTKV